MASHESVVFFSKRMVEYLVEKSILRCSTPQNITEGLFPSLLKMTSYILTHTQKKINQNFSEVGNGSSRMEHFYVPVPNILFLPKSEFGTFIL